MPGSPGGFGARRVMGGYAHDAFFIELSIEGGCGGSFPQNQEID
jgi:hypothetical protein